MKWPSHHINFTKAALAKAPPPKKGQRDYYYDEREQGLVMALTPAGSRRFHLDKRVGGRPECIYLGKFPDLSVENARKLAAEAKGSNAVLYTTQRPRHSVRAAARLSLKLDRAVRLLSELNRF